MPTGTRHLPLLLIVVLSGLVGGPPAVARDARERRAEEDDLRRYLTVYTEVLSLVDRAYIEATDARTLTLAAIEGATEALDPFSLYVPAEEVDGYLAARYRARRRGGMRILKERGVAYVLAVEDGSPASRAGIEGGEIVKTLQGRPTRTMPPWRIPQILAHAENEVELELIGPGGEERTVRVELAELEEPAVRLATVRGVPVLRIPRFSESTPPAVDAALSEGIEDRLVVDLRGVAGGDAEAAYAVAERFAAGELGALVARDGPVRRFAAPAAPSWKGDLAVLVDRGTQGPAEILASVLRRSCGARLVGQRTFGHAGRTEAIRLSSGALLELTGAFYTGPDREPLLRGLDPDVSVSRDPTAAEDEILERALRLLLASGR